MTVVCAPLASTGTRHCPGHHVACMVDAANDGGFALVGLARAFIR